MSHRSRQLRVSSLARVEGEGALHIVVEDEQVTQAELEIYESPRFFEAFLRGRAHTEVVDITSRICGICPVAYQTSAWQAIENVCGVVVPGPIAPPRCRCAGWPRPLAGDRDQCGCCGARPNRPSCSAARCWSRR